jgi:hypothetical protein
MRLTTGFVNDSFAQQSNSMKKLIAFVLVLLVTLNVAVLLSSRPKNANAAGKCSALKMPKIELTGLNPGVFPGLIKF